MRLFVSCIFLSFILSSCTMPGSREFITYEESFARAQEAANDVIVVYNQYDHANRRQRSSRSSFDPSLADIYVSGALTPTTKMIQEGFAAASTYTQVLSRYVNGDTLSLQSKNLAALQGSLASTAATLGRTGAGAQAGAVVGAAAAVGNAVLVAADRDAFIAAVENGGDTVVVFLEKVRALTPAMYAAATKAKAQNNFDYAKLTAYQSMLGAWVLLLDQTLVDLESLRSAVTNPELSTPVIENLASSAALIDAHARRIAAARAELERVY